MADEQEVIRCVRCNHEAKEKEKFCTQCGAPLINNCSDSPGLISGGCGKKNGHDAAYCAYCGEPTLFKQMGLIPDTNFGKSVPINNSPNPSFFKD